jgi:hypothetical protein
VLLIGPSRSVAKALRDRGASQHQTKPGGAHHLFG